MVDLPSSRWQAIRPVVLVPKIPVRDSSIALVSHSAVAAGRRLKRACFSILVGETLVHRRKLQLLTVQIIGFLTARPFMLVARDLL